MVGAENGHLRVAHATFVFAQYLKEYHQKFSVSFGIFQNKDAMKIITIVYFSIVPSAHGPGFLNDLYIYGDST